MFKPRLTFLLCALFPALCFAQFPVPKPRPGATPRPGLTPAKPATAAPMQPGAGSPAPMVPAKSAADAAEAPEQSVEKDTDADAEPAETVKPKSAAVRSTANILTEEERAAGWKLLFDGKQLLGLRGAKAGALPPGWVIEEDSLHLVKDIKDMGRITGGDLLTSDFYLDFDFRFQFKLLVSSESGVRYLFREQMGSVKSPEGHEFQIIDNVHNPVGLKGGPLRRTGALDGVIPAGANAKLLTSDPEKRIFEEPWNDGRIVVSGNRVEHWLNGEKVVEYDLLSPTLRQSVVTSRARVVQTFGMKFKTKLLLLDEGTEVSYRNLKILALPAPPVPQPTLTPTPTPTPRPVVPLPPRTVVPPGGAKPGFPPRPAVPVPPQR